MHQHGEQRRVHGEVFARRVHVVAGGGEQLAELRVDDLGGVEHGDEAHEIARQHAVEQQVHLIRRQLDARLGQRAGDLRLRLGDLVLVLDDALLGILDVAVEARHRVVEHARQHGVLRRRDLLFLQRGDVGFDLANVLTQALDLLLHLDDRHVGDDAEGRVEQVADARLAVLARLRPQRGEDELVAAGQLLRLRALLGGVLQDGIDGEHELARLLVGGFALARILRLDGCGGGGGWAYPAPAGRRRSAWRPAASSRQPSRSCPRAPIWKSARQCRRGARSGHWRKWMKRKARRTASAAVGQRTSAAMTKASKTQAARSRRIQAIRCFVLSRLPWQERRVPTSAGRSGARPSAPACG